jgi:hypothetical protein
MHAGGKLEARASTNEAFLGDRHRMKITAWI